MMDEEKPKRKKRLSKREWIAEQKAKPVTEEMVMNYAMYLINRQDYTENRLSDKLNHNFTRNRSYNNAVLKRLKQHGYINDTRFAERYVISLLNQRIGKGKIREKLYRKGFPSCIIDAALYLTEEKDFFPDVVALKRKRYGDAPVTDPKLKQKALGFLTRKGFSFDLCLKALAISKEDVQALDEDY